MAFLLFYQRRFMVTIPIIPHLARTDAATAGDGGGGGYRLFPGPFAHFAHSCLIVGSSGLIGTHFRSATGSS